MAFPRLPLRFGARLMPGASMYGGEPMNPNALASLGPAPGLPLGTRIGATLRGLGGALNPQGTGIEALVAGLSGGYSGTADALEQARLAPLLFQQNQEDRAIQNHLQQAQADNLASLAVNRGGEAPDTTGAFSVQHRIAGSSLGSDYDPAKTYTVMLDRGGRIVGRPMEEAAPARSTLSRMGEMTPTAQQGIIDRTSAAFARDTKDYAKAAEAWSQVNHVLQRARSNTHSPDDIVQLLDGISRLNNPGAVVRTGTVQLQLQKIGSLSQKLQMWLQRGATGAWPTEVVEGIATAARQIAQEHQKNYNDIRRRAIQRGNNASPGLGQQLDDYLPNVWAQTDVEDVPDSGSATYAPPP